MRHESNDDSDDEGGGSKEDISFLELFSPLDNSAAAVGCQPCIQW
jgi:hypothetical protein